MWGSGWWSYLRAPDQKPKVTWSLLRRVLSYSYPYRWQIAAMLALILFTTALGLLTPLIMRDLIDRAIPNQDLNRLVWLALALLAIPLVSGVVGIFQRRLNAMVGEGVIYDLRVALFSRLQRMSLRFYTHTKVGELMSRMNNDVIGAHDAISSTIVGMITDVLRAVATLAVMMTLEWRLTLISVAIMPLFILAARRLGGRLREIARDHMDANAHMNAMMHETLNIGGALLVKLFGRMNVEVDRFQNRAGQVRDIGVRRAQTGAAFFMLIGLISAVGTAFVYGLGGYLVIRDVFSVGTIVAFGAYLANLYTALSGLANAPVEFATSVVSFERVFEVVDLPAEIEDRPSAVNLASVRGDLEFDDVSFRYEIDEAHLLSNVERVGQMDQVRTALSGGKEESGEEEAHPISQARDQALDNISFRVRPGQLAALVGPSGAGKTTLTYLIPRLYDPTGGCIRLDGTDLRDITLESLTAQVGMVTQETHLFHDTILTNLKYARLDATRAQVEEAARAANIHDFITGLPDGYDTVVGERGYRLSGGEKQRLALARVILKDPSILVLDEATSHLDSESEALIQEALKHVMAGRTSIVIAHRLSTILAADIILVLNRGRIVEQGTHAELLNLDGLYASLYYTQFHSSRSSQPL